MKKLLIPFITSISLLTLSACGGSGGSTSTAPTPSPTSKAASSAANSSSALSSPSSTAISSAAASSVTAISGAPITYQAEENFFSGGVTKADTYLQNFVAQGARAIFTINTEATGSYTVNLQFSNATDTTKTLNIYVNGLFALTTNLAATGGNTTWATQTEHLVLRTGINTISYQFDAGNTGGVAIDSLSVEGGTALATRGATLAYQEYEAEDATTNGLASNASTTYLTVESESSGRKFVNLSATGQYVEWVAQKAANTLVLRYNLADASAGGGTNNTLSLYVNGTKIKTLNLSSHFAWVYGDYPYNDNPTNLKGHRFFDESRFSNLTIPTGATVRLQKDAEDAAAYYNIDLIDLEKIEAAYSMPNNFISITDFGAVANDALDDTQAIINAITSAKANSKGVWIPEGTFIVSGRPDLSNIHIRGAGTWYTILQGINGKGGFLGKGDNVTVADLSLWSDSSVRNDAADNPAFEGNFGTGSLIQNVWIEHMKVGLWVVANTNGLYIVDGRIRDTWADGINFAGGVKNSTISHFNFRNTGDDSMAMWSNGAANINNAFRFNTAQLPVLANTFAIYGGQDNKILDNIGSDTVVSSAGIAISTRFNPTALAGTVEAKRNTLNRTGGFDPGWNTTFGAVWIFSDSVNVSIPIVIDDLTLNNSTYDGILMSYNKNFSAITLNNVQINGAGAYGINLGSISGAGNFSNVTVTDAMSGGLNASTTFSITKGEGNSGW